MAGIDKSALEFLFVGPLFSIFKKLNSIERKLDDMATQADVDALAERVGAIGTQQVKAVGEVRTAVDALKEQIANLPEPQPALDLSALDTAVTAAEQGSQELDDLNPDATEPEPTPAEPETPTEPEAPVDPSTLPVDEIPATPVEEA